MRSLKNKDYRRTMSRAFFVFGETGSMQFIFFMYAYFSADKPLHPGRRQFSSFFNESHFPVLISGSWCNYSNRFAITLLAPKHICKYRKTSLRLHIPKHMSGFACYSVSLFPGYKINGIVTSGYFKDAQTDGSFSILP